MQPVLALLLLSPAMFAGVPPAGMADAASAARSAQACWENQASGWKTNADRCVQLLDAWQLEVDKSKPAPKPFREGTLLSVDSWHSSIDNDAKYSQIIWECSAGWLRKCGTIGDGIRKVVVYENARTQEWVKVVVWFQFRATPNRRLYNLDTGASQTYYGRQLSWDVNYRGQIVGGNRSTVPTAPKPAQRIIK